MSDAATRLNPAAALRSRVFDVVPDPVLFRLLAYQHRLYEPELQYVQQLVARATMAVDVGAWWGPWTYWLARAAREVVTFEPIPHLATFIESVCPSNVSVVNAALSDNQGEASFWVPARGRGTEGVASLEPSAVRAESQEISVRTMRLDDLKLANVGLIKIDVEGHELAVLRGAVDTLARCRPTLVVEVEEQGENGKHASEVFEWIMGLDYAGKFLFRGAWHPLADFDLYEHQLRWQSEIRQHGYVWNLVRNARRYVNNFVFTPEQPAAQSKRGD